MFSISHLSTCFRFRVGSPSGKQKSCELIIFFSISTNYYNWRRPLSKSHRQVPPTVVWANILYYWDLTYSFIVSLQNPLDAACTALKNANTIVLPECTHSIDDDDCVDGEAGNVVVKFSGRDGDSLSTRDFPSKPKNQRTLLID